MITISAANSKIIKQRSAISIPQSVRFCKKRCRSSKNNANSAGELFCHCLNPTEMLKKSDNELQCFTQDLTTACIDRNNTSILPSKPLRKSLNHSAFRYTESKAFFKSINAHNNLVLLLIKLCFKLCQQYFRNPKCVSDRKLLSSDQLSTL